YSKAHESLGVSQEALAALADELWSRRGESIVIAGEDYRAQVAAMLLNAALDNSGKTVDSSRAPFVTQQGTTSDLTDLIAAINSGKVKRVFVHGVNPVYAAAPSTGFVEAFKK